MEFLVVAAVYLVIGPGLGIAGFFMARQHTKMLELLTRRIDAATREISILSAARQGQAEPVSDITPEVPVAAEVEAPWVAPPEAVPILETTEPEPAPVPAARETIEQKLASRWLLWLGAATLALGGAFLVKYVIDQGWFGPTARSVLGFLFGCALVIGGEWLRQRPAQRALAAIGPNYLPPAVTAAGISIAYSSAYAAFELYNLVSPLVAFGLLGALSMAAVFLSLLQGPLVALLGVTGGFVTPLLVSSGPPSAWGLFIYLLFIIGSALAIVRYTGAWWLGQVALAGAAGWLLLWNLTAWQPGDAGALGTFLIGLMILAVYVPSPSLLSPEALDQKKASGGTTGAPELTAWLAVALVAVFTFVLLRMDMYGGASLVAQCVFVGLCFFVGFRAPLFDRMPVIAEVLTLAGIAAWHIPRIVGMDSPLDAIHPPQSESLPHGFEAGVIVPPELVFFLGTTTGFAVLFGAGAFLALWYARRPAVWAAVSATTPVLLLAVAYWRIEAFGVNFSWALVAITLACLNVAAASRLQRRRTEPPWALSLAAYAAAAAAAIGLGATMVLQEAWLTVALSLELPALAWINLRLAVPPLRRVAMAVAAVVLVRLIVNYQLIDYPVGGVPLLNWMLYGYGIPALAFFGASLWFKRDCDDALVMVLQAGALVFATLLITLEIHNCIAGPIRSPQQGLLEPSVRSVAWLIMAIGLARGGQAASPVYRWAHTILAGAAVTQILGWQLLAENPLWSDDSVGSLPILNLISLAYGVPAVLMLIYDRLAVTNRILSVVSRVFCLALVFLDLSLEVRHAFQGEILSGPEISDAEWYSYSVAWLGLAVVLLVLGIRSASTGLRYGSLGVLLFTVGKVFLSDMGNLTGLYRAASFAGLGLCLIGVGYLYQRFVFTAPARRAAEG